MASTRTQYWHLNGQALRDIRFPAPQGAYGSVEDCALGERVGDLWAIGHLVSQPGCTS